jgi:chemotaxis response regulator CheB
MPREAIAQGAVDEIVAVKDMASRVMSYLALPMRKSK